MDLVFAAGSSSGTMQCIDVVLVNDFVEETNEIFAVTLTTSSLFVAQPLRNNVTLITITDFDGECRASSYR